MKIKYGAWKLGDICNLTACKSAFETFNDKPDFFITIDEDEDIKIAQWSRRIQKKHPTTVFAFGECA